MKKFNMKEYLALPNKEAKKYIAQFKGLIKDIAAPKAGIYGRLNKA